MQHFQIIIIGGGPIGLACALEARKRGFQYLILERGTLVNSIYNYPVNMMFFSTSERLEIGGVPFVSNNPKPIRNEALEYYRRVTGDSKINIHLFEEVLEVKKTENEYEVHTAKQSYTATYVVIASGFYDIPYLLNVPGENLAKVKHYYKDPAFYAFQKVLVVGAANSAIDAALETWRKGATVTLVVRGSEISNRVKYWVKPDIENRIAEGSINAYFNAQVHEIRETEVVIQTPEGLVTVENDWVLAMTGYQPNLSFLQKMGITLSDDAVRKPTYNEETQETNQPNIFLAGVICGGMNTHRLFIENSREHAQKIMSAIAAKEAGPA
ncbi:MAG TPA: YpdA family putative bacillithiol disulfide reductase [Chitinophagaceae bacterium]|nr:YpdA family putative bacillithiol disulfide reductase [Chitinophagaceae bacterium]